MYLLVIFIYLVAFLICKKQEKSKAICLIILVIAFAIQTYCVVKPDYKSVSNIITEAFLKGGEDN